MLGSDSSAAKLKWNGLYTRLTLISRYLSLGVLKDNINQGNSRSITALKEAIAVKIQVVI